MQRGIPEVCIEASFFSAASEAASFVATRFNAPEVPGRGRIDRKGGPDYSVSPQAGCRFRGQKGLCRMSFFPRDLAVPAAPLSPVIEWEEPSCLLCAARNWQPLVEARDCASEGTGFWFAVVQCQNCGLCFTNPRPNVETIGQFYPPSYRPHKSPSRKRSHWWPRWLSLQQQPRKELSLLPVPGRGRLLDFGCGGGAFLEAMSRQAWQVTGLDVSTAAVQRVRTDLGLRALVGTLPHPELRPASFDVITMWHSLEHVHQPLEVLREAYRLLVPGGQLLISVPNIDSLPFRWFGSDWYGLDLPRHLTHFAPWTLHLSLERVGFKVGPIRMVRHSDWLRASARLALQTGAGLRWHRWLRRKSPSRLATWYCSFTHQADCIMVAAER
jgi:2-polyprenyl-3-methyl-5-hydroxy-6-metoxy-1,4-benzoquinol methylase